MIDSHYYKTDEDSMQDIKNSRNLDSFELRELG